MCGCRSIAAVRAAKTKQYVHLLRDDALSRWERNEKEQQDDLMGRCTIWARNFHELSCAVMNVLTRGTIYNTRRQMNRTNNKEEADRSFVHDTSLRV